MIDDYAAVYLLWVTGYPFFPSSIKIVYILIKTQVDVERMRTRARIPHDVANLLFALNPAPR